MPLQYTDDEIKAKLADILKHDDRKAIATSTGIGYTIVKENFNPEAVTRQSYAFLLLRIACAVWEIDPERGDKFMDELRDAYEASKTRGRTHISIGNELQRVISIAGQVLADRADGGERYEQLTRVQDIGRRVIRVRGSLLDEIANEPKGRLTP
jgi:hypothetical protein